MPANVENSAVAIGLERSFSLKSLKKVISKNVQLPHSCTHLTWYQSNFSKQVFNSTWTVKFHMFKLDVEKAKEPEIKLPKSTGSSKNQESSRKTSTSASVTTQNPSTVWITTNLENSSRDGNTRPPDLPPKKSACSSQNQTWNNGLVPNWERSMSRLYVVTLLI